jgi:hypothetical protein
MKKLMLLIFAVSLFGCAGMEQAKDADKPIELIFDAPGKTKDQLFSATKSWIAETFVSAKAVIDDADKDAGRIIAKGRVVSPCKQGMGCLLTKYIAFTLRIDMKDGKARMTFSNLSVISPSHGQYAETENAIWMAGDLEDAKVAFSDLKTGLQGNRKNLKPPPASPALLMRLLPNSALGILASHIANHLDNPSAAARHVLYCPTIFVSEIVVEPKVSSEGAKPSVGGHATVNSGALRVSTVMRLLPQ